MTKISPSLLAADLANLAADCRCVLDAGADMLHFDVMDGIFVPNISMGIPVLQCLHKALPDAVVDVHLMITDPARYAADFARAGARYITFHYESVADPAPVIRTIRDAGCLPGIAISPKTDPEVLLPWLEQLDLVLVMSVEPGFSGQKFRPQALDKLRFLRAACAARGLKPLLEVDGGIDAVSGTGAQCVEAGADLLVAGNAVFAAPDPAAVVRALRSL